MASHSITCESKLPIKGIVRGEYAAISGFVLDFVGDHSTQVTYISQCDWKVSVMGINEHMKHLKHYLKLKINPKKSPSFEKVNQLEKKSSSLSPNLEKKSSLSPSFEKMHHLEKKSSSSPTLEKKSNHSPALEKKNSGNL